MNLQTLAVFVRPHIGREYMPPGFNVRNDGLCPEFVAVDGEKIPGALVECVLSGFALRWLLTNSHQDLRGYCARVGHHGISQSMRVNEFMLLIEFCRIVCEERERDRQRESALPEQGEAHPDPFMSDLARFQSQMISTPHLGHMTVAGRTPEECELKAQFLDRKVFPRVET